MRTKCVGQKFNKLFCLAKPIIGMIHLAGNNREDKVSRALDELCTYDECELDGAIIEDYHGNEEEVIATLEASQGMPLELIRGINLLRDPYKSFELASRYGAKFVQFDSVQTNTLNDELYSLCRNKYPLITSLGGVGFKYTLPSRLPLDEELAHAFNRCEAIVTTGEGTGIETPIEKLIEYKKQLGNFPLVVGAGVNSHNIRSQLSIVDGAIIGSFFKKYGNTEEKVERRKVKELMNIVKEVRV